MPVKIKQLKLNLEIPRRFGGRQPGAGRPCGPRPKVLHRARESFRKDHPLHVTFRVRSDVPVLRQPRFIRAFRRTLREGCDRDGFRVIHYSVQRDHVHCVVEASDKQSLGSGMKSLGARFARAVNRVFSRSGPVLDGRYHARVLRTPNEVRRALAYVLLNARKHFKQRVGYAPPVQLDQASSGVWFQGWKIPGLYKPPDYVRETALPQTWLMMYGWRKHRLIHPAEVPG